MHDILYDLHHVMLWIRLMTSCASVNHSKYRGLEYYFIYSINRVYCCSAGLFNMCIATNIV